MTTALIFHTCIAYHKWINALANVDERLIKALQLIRDKTWSYSTGSTLHSNLLAGTLFSSSPQSRSTLTISSPSEYAKDLGYPASWGDPNLLPSHGGPATSQIWKALNVPGRDGVGGIPCELLHGTVKSASCTTKAASRGLTGMKTALLIYIPVHIIPALLRLRKLPNASDLLNILLPRIGGAFRSSIFLSSFLSAFYFACCTTRTLIPSLLAKISPSLAQAIPSDFLDGPYGCTMAACFTCGGSIFIEEGRRRGEMALYVLPRALETVFSQAKGRAGIIVERTLCIISLAYLLTSAIHSRDTLRGLSGWSLGLILKHDTSTTNSNNSKLEQ